jgi:heme-degrading monooxygenase HmoA
LADRAWTFWTLTAWDSRESMRRYMTTGPHRAAMSKLLHWCDEASVVHWDQRDDAFPSWAEADRRMRAEGRPSKLRHPGPRHETLGFRPARTTLSAPLRPASTP